MEPARLPDDRCRHCASVIPSGLVDVAPGFCCRGCAAVHALLVAEGLTRYYDLAGDDVAPAVIVDDAGAHAWLDPLVSAALAALPSDAPTARATLDVDVQGIHCAACVWLLAELAKRRGAAFTVNSALGTGQLRFPRGFDVRAFVVEAERFGYRLGPPHKADAGAPARKSSLPLRLGVCVALTMNIMLFAVSFYVGLTPAGGPLFDVFSRLTFIFSTAVVVVGGSLFFESAWRALRRRVLHLDLPIALGILLGYVSSLVASRFGRADVTYLDTLSVFVTLMLVGRWLEERVVERNRRYLLEDKGLDAIVVRRVVDGRVESIPAPRLAPGDVVLLAPGDLLPVDGELVDAEATVSRDWITGEAEPTALTAGATFEAGSCNRGRRAVRVRAKTALDGSPLHRLIRGVAAPRDGEALPAHLKFVDRFARVYVATVLALGALALAIWIPLDRARALEVAAALLVITCPCAIGIAAPLAHELVLARLRRGGLFVTRGDLLARLTRVRTLIFDKTGTLTLGRLRLAEEAQAAVAALAPEARDAAYDMAARSSHPVAAVLADALAGRGARLDEAADVHEIPGRGLELRRAGRLYRLGRFDAGGDQRAEANERDSVLVVDGVEIARFAVVEQLRPDAKQELARLAAAGLEIHLLSGDAPARVATIAAQLGLPAARARGGLSPDEKAAAVAALDGGREDTLYLGDGVNDALAFERAFCAGTPAIDRPIIPGKADFFLVGEGLAPLTEGLALARVLQRVLRRNLMIAIAYNTIGVGLCLAGLMTPVVAAIAMPVSSLTIIGLTVSSLSARRHERARLAATLPLTAADAAQRKLVWTS
jgi:Cu2+-exporting ATPase